MKPIKISIKDYDASPKKQRDRFALVGLADTYLEEQDWRSTNDGVVVSPDALDDAMYLMSRCKKLGIVIG